MEIAFGFLLAVFAGILQGSFILPMKLVNNWKWENTWFVFSILGMIVLNLLLAFIFINNLESVYLSVATIDLFLLGLCGFGWGLGAVLFGIGMERLGMALGYPIIMGLIAGLGGLMPLFILNPGDVLKLSGLIMITGIIIIVIGIIICSKAAALKTKENTEKVKKNSFSTGLMIAVAAGVLSSLPNIGYSFGGEVREAAIENGTSPAMAGNAVWALFFSIGFIPNLFYTVWLLTKNRTFSLFFSESPLKNMTLGLLMSILWIGSFYIYGYCSFKLGNWGNIIGWPLFISFSIIVGNLWGIWSGEWKVSSLKARSTLNIGLITLVLAMVIIGLSKLF